MAENIREIALDALLVLEKSDEYSHHLVRAVLDKYAFLPARDRAFFKRVVEGTVERRLELDYYLESYSSLPPKKMKPLIRCLLRMSVYQLCCMDSVPDRAVCDEACKLAAKRGFRNLRGFVNGVLRTISREKNALPLPRRDQEPIRFLSVKYSMPEWLVRLWLDEYGIEITETLLGGLMEIHPVCLRFRTDLSGNRREELLDSLRRTGAVLRQSAYLPYMYFLESGPKDGMAGGMNSLPGFASGELTVQDVSSALAVEAAGIGKDDFVIDVCAAPGGKSILAAEKAARVLARDISEEKADLIRENIARMGTGNIEVQVFDGREFDESLQGTADVVLLDVPCSGLGVIGKKRDIKYRVTPEGLEALRELQRDIVRCAGRLVKPGGTLAYSTCTINRAENEEMVRFIASLPEFVPVSLEDRLPSGLLEQKRRLEELLEHNKGAAGETGTKLSDKEKAACIQLLPGYMESDGFFIALFCRK